MRKVNANTATEAEVAAALQAAAVSNAARWAKEVVEYRPNPLLTATAPFARLLTACGYDGVETRERVTDAAADAAGSDTGVTPGPDGSLYIGETEKGRIWRVIYTGELSRGALTGGSSNTVYSRSKRPLDQFTSSR